MNALWVCPLILATPFAISYVLILSKWRFSTPITLSAAGLLIIAVTVLNFITIKDMMWMVEERPILDLACRLLNIFIEAIVAFILTKQSRSQTVFILLSMCLCVYIVDTVAITMDLWIGSDLASLLFKLALYLFMAAILYRLRKTFWDVAFYMKNHLWMLCIVQAVLFVCSTMVISFPVPLSLAPANIPLALMIGVANVAVYGIFLYIFRLIRKQSKLESNAEAFHIYAETLERQNSIVSKNAEKAAIFRHDIRHVIQMMSVSADNGDLDGVRALIKHLDDNVSVSGGLCATPITGCTLLDTVIYRYVNYAKEANIDLSVNVTDIELAKAETTELAVFLSNALENAVHACKKKGKNRAIKVTGCKIGVQYFWEIANTFSDTVHFDPSTGLPIAVENEHGTGVKSIAYFAEKYGANLTYKTQEDWIHLGLLMKTE